MEIKINKNLVFSFGFEADSGGADINKFLLITTDLLLIYDHKINVQGPERPCSNFYFI